MARMEQLKEFLRKLADGGIALAFSGGADSSFLLAALKELHDERPFPLKALTMQTVFQPEDELADARRTAAELEPGQGCRLPARTGTPGLYQHGRFHLCRRPRRAAHAEDADQRHYDRNPETVV